MVTTTTSFSARLCPSYISREPAPLRKAPPCIQTITGSSSSGLSAGVQTLR